MRNQSVPATLKGFIYYSKSMSMSTIGYREFQLSELQEILKVPKSFKIFNRFKEKVLFKAKEDINKFTDLQIEVY